MVSWVPGPCLSSRRRRPFSDEGHDVECDVEPEAGTADSRGAW